MELPAEPIDGPRTLDGGNNTDKHPLVAERPATLAAPALRRNLRREVTDGERELVVIYIPPASIVEKIARVSERSGFNHFSRSNYYSSNNKDRILGTGRTLTLPVKWIICGRMHPPLTAI